VVAPIRVTVRFSTQVKQGVLLAAVLKRCTVVDEQKAAQAMGRRAASRRPSSTSAATLGRRQHRN